MQIERISYKYGMLKKPSQRKKLRARHLVKGSISEEILSVINEEEILSLSGTLGYKDGAMPIEYEEVKIVADGKQTTFEIYNKGMSMFTNETPELKRAFKLCVILQREMRL